MSLDIRFPIALLFIVLGGLLTSFGAFSDDSIYVRSLGINVNIVWGTVLFLFGAVLWLAARKSAPHAGARRSEPTTPTGKSSAPPRPGRRIQL